MMMRSGVGVLTTVVIMRVAQVSGLGGFLEAGMGPLTASIKALQDVGDGHEGATAELGAGGVECRTTCSMSSGHPGWSW